MAIKLQQKKELAAQISGIADECLAIVAADYSGLSSPEMTDLRTKARGSAVKLKVVRNTLAKCAFNDTPYKVLNEKLLGPVLLAFSIDAPGSAARLLRDFAKDHSNLEVTAIVLSGKLLPASQLDAVANLPTRDEALSKLLAVMKAPITKLVQTIAAPQVKLVRTLAAIRDTKS